MDLITHRQAVCVLGQFTNTLTSVRQGEEKESGLMSGLVIPPQNCSSPNAGASGSQSPRTLPSITESPQRAGDRDWRLLSHHPFCDTHSTRNSKGVQELKSASGIDFLFIGVSRVTLQCRDKCVIWACLCNNRSLVLEHEETNTASALGASGPEHDIYMQRSDRIIRDRQAVHINKNHI